MATVTRNNKKKSIFIITALIVVTILIIGYFQLSTKNHREEIVKWLDANQITYKDLSVADNGHFKITDAEVSFNDNIKLAAPNIEGDMSRSSGVKEINAQNVALSVFEVELVMPKITITNATIGTSFKDASYLDKAHPLLISLLNANFSEANIPTLDLHYANKKQDNSTSISSTITASYKDIILKNAKDGLIESFNYNSLAFNVDFLNDTKNKGELKLTTGQSTLKDLNYKAISTFIFEPAQGKNEILHLYGEQIVHDIDYNFNIAEFANIDKQLIKTHYSKVKMSPFAIAQQNTPPAQWEIFTKENWAILSDKNNEKQEELALKLALNYIDILETIAPFSASVENIENETFSQISANSELSTKQSYGEIAYSYADSGFNYAMNNYHYIMMDSDKIFVDYEFDNLSFKNIRFPEALKNGKELINEYLADKNAFKKKNKAEFGQTLARLLIPRFDEINLNGLIVKSDFAELPKDNNTIITLAALNIKAEHQISFIPTALSIDLKDLKIPMVLLKKNPFFYSNEDDVLALNTLGYDDLTISSKLDISWDKATNTLSLNTLTFNVQDMLSTEIKNQLANANEWLFSGDAIMMAATATDLSLKSFEVKTNIDPLRARYENWGKRTGVDTAQQYKDFAGNYTIIATQALSKIVKENPELAAFAYNVTEKLSKAMNDFILNGGTFEMILKTNSSNGLSLADFVGQKDLSAALLKKVDFSAQTKK